MPPILYLDYLPNEPANAKTKVYRFTSGMITLGREEGNDVVVLSSALSRQHARILPAGNHWAYCDLGSTNGSWLNGTQLAKDRFVLVRNQDELILADAHFNVRLVVEPEFPGARYTRSLLVFDGEKFHSEFPMESDEAIFIIGGKDSQLKVADSDQIEIAIKEGVLSLIVKDTSVTGTLNGELIISGTPLKDGDFLEIGKKEILVNYSDKTTDFYTGPAVEDVNPFGVEDEYDAQGLDETGGQEDYQAQLPPMLGAQSSSPTWDMKSRASNPQNRRFIFGEDGADSNAGTIALPKEQNPFRDPNMAKGVKSPKQVSNQSGFEMSLSGRMASVPEDTSALENKERQRRLILGVTFIAFALILGLAVIIMLVLN
jgi:pSer/pThr/pTyr-binding forkhead associated (FHA) protein